MTNATTDKDNLALEPPSNSLFNVQTLKQFVELGMQTPDIIEDPSLVFGTDFALSSSWTDITQTLGLNDTKQAYMMWLWLKTCKEFNLERSNVVGGNKEIGIMGFLGSEALENTMTIMQFEVPMLTYATQMMIQFDA